MQSLTASGLLALGTHTIGLIQGVGPSTSSIISSDWSHSSSFSTLSRIPMDGLDDRDNLLIYV